MANVDKVKVDAMMAMISMSLMWAMPSNIPVDSNASKSKGIGTNAPIERVVEEKKYKPAAIKTFGKVKMASVKKVNKMLDTYLTKKGSVDTVVITVGSNVEKFGKDRLGVDFSQMKEGEQIKGMKGVQIFIAENEIETLLPSVLMTLNEYQKTH